MYSFKERGRRKCKIWKLFIIISVTLHSLPSIICFLEAYAESRVQKNYPYWVPESSTISIWINISMASHRWIWRKTGAQSHQHNGSQSVTPLHHRLWSNRWHNCIHSSITSSYWRVACASWYIIIIITTEIEQKLFHKGCNSWFSVQVLHSDIRIILVVLSLSSLFHHQIPQIVKD